MAYLYNFIYQMDVGKLRADEIRKCLLYLNYMSKFDPRIKRSSVPITKKLIDRLQELQEE